MKSYHFVFTRIRSRNRDASEGGMDMLFDGRPENEYSQQDGSQLHDPSRKRSSLSPSPLPPMLVSHLATILMQAPKKTKTKPTKMRARKR